MRTEILKRFRKANGVVLEVEYKVDRVVTRVLYCTNQGVSRHANMDDLNACLDGKRDFNRDAFFFKGEIAKYEIERVLKHAVGGDAKWCKAYLSSLKD